jgi:hypothetical protein
VPVHNIPYRCLYSKNIENLLFGGRCISVSHIALGTVRIEGTCAATGQAAATAATLCLKYDTTPRGIYKDHIKDLQQTLLKNDQYIVGITNEDAADLARTATVAASSSATCEAFDPRRVKMDDPHALTTSRAAMFPRGVNRRIEAISLLLESAATKPVPVTVHLRGARPS